MSDLIMFLGCMLASFIIAFVSFMLSNFAMHTKNADQDEFMIIGFAGSTVTLALILAFYLFYYFKTKGAL